VVTGGTGTYTVGETVTQGTTTAKVLAWTPETFTIRITDLVGTVTTGSNIIGSSSGATWLYDISSGSSSTTTNIYQSGPAGGSSDTGFTDNPVIDFELNDIVDFTENNPFGEDID
jgi:hypothetical protein